MCTTEEQELISALKQLAFSIKNEIENSHSRGVIQPEEEVYFRWKIDKDKFQYTKKGVTGFSARQESITKKSWLRASIKIENSIKESDEYSFALGLLNKNLGIKDKIARGLKYFIRKLIYRYLDESKFSEIEVDVLITNFLKDIKEEPLKYGADVELDGIVILPDKIQFKTGDVNIILRQTRIEDLEKEFIIPVYRFVMRPRWTKPPSAILNIEFLARQVNEVQTKVEQAITILRLFKLGSVKYFSYCTHSDSITDVTASGIIIGRESEIALEKTQIKDEDIQKLKNFWQTMAKFLPPSFYEFGKEGVDYITIAYKRYCDALLQNGLLERRIANAVMGLESLFLKGEEREELIYRLSMRIAKIFSLLEYDSKVKEVVKDAYKIRSLFVHGGHLSDKDKRALNNKHGDIRSFLLLLLNYLRISIIMRIFIKKEKEEFLDLIDNALVDKNKDSQLNNLLNRARNVFGIIVE